MLKNEYACCESCALGKTHRDEFPSNIDRRRRDVLELVHTNVCGPMKSRCLLMTAQYTLGRTPLG
ncbi:hypothetical protein, partial [Actinobacillus pleuropneumoniae]